MDVDILIVDENDQVIGQKSRAEMDYSTDTCRVSAVWIINSSGEVLIAQRKFTKKRDPGLWGPSVAGTVEAGESYEKNAQKEVEEELGISNFTLKELAKIQASPHRNYFCQVYSALVDLPIEDFSIQEDEVEQIRWISLEELRKDIEGSPKNYLASMQDWVTMLENERIGGAGSVYTKKSYPELFEKVLSGEKTFDMRIADFDCQPGDILEQIEVGYDGVPMGRSVRKKVGIVLKTKDIDFWSQQDIDRYGYQVISLLNEEVEISVK